MIQIGGYMDMPLTAATGILFGLLTGISGGGTEYLWIKIYVINSKTGEVIWGRYYKGNAGPTENEIIEYAMLLLRKFPKRIQKIR